MHTEILSSKVITYLQGLFKEHSIRTGRLLLSLEESHLQEMGVAKVGHRLEIMEGINQLRKEAGLIERSRLVDIKSLLKQ